jgi:hypothetical protein
LQTFNKGISSQFRQPQRHLLNGRLQIETTLLGKDQEVPGLQFRLLLRRKLENVQKKQQKLVILVSSDEGSGSGREEDNEYNTLHLELVN